MLLTLRRFLGEVITRRREELGLSQQELAQLAGVHLSYVAQVEQGSRSVNLYALDGISDVLDCKPSVLFAEAELKAFHAAGEHAETFENPKAKVPRKFKSPFANRK